MSNKWKEEYKKSEGYLNIKKRKFAIYAILHLLLIICGCIFKALTSDIDTAGTLDIFFNYGFFYIPLWWLLVPTTFILALVNGIQYYKARNN